MMDSTHYATTVNPAYTSAVTNFKYPEENLSPIEQKTANQFSLNISLRIDNTHYSHRPKLKKLMGQEPSLLHTCYLVIQTLDKHENTLTRIGNASNEEKNKIAHAIRLLTPEYGHIDKDIIKQITILFGMHILANPELNRSPEHLAIIDTQQKGFVQLTEMMNKFDVMGALSLAIKNTMLGSAGARVAQTERDICKALFETENVFPLEPVLEATVSHT